jgi:hypothetical protein
MRTGWRIDDRRPIKEAAMSRIRWCQWLAAVSTAPLVALAVLSSSHNDGNPETAGDPSWQPFLNTPNYPDYTSDANNVTDALTRMLALFFGTDEVTFTVTSEHPLAMLKRHPGM